MIDHSRARWDESAEAACGARIADGSRVIRAADRALGWAPTAWSRSHTAGALQDRWNEILSLELSQRIRLLGCALLTAVSTASVLSWLAGTPANGAQRGCAILLLAIGIMLAAASQPLARAWRERTGRGPRSV